MRGAGLFLSGLGHAGLIGLALVAPPWLAARPGKPVPVVTVSLVREVDLAALEAAATAPAPAAPEAAPVTAPVTAPAPPAPAAALAPEEAPEAEVPEVSLAPGFDAESPLGLGAEVATAPLDAVAPVAPDRTRAPVDMTHVPPPPPRPPAGLAPSDMVERIFETDPPVEEPVPAPIGATAEAYAAAVAEAIAAARVYPPAARRRGVEGQVGLVAVVAREGRLVTARVARSSGDEALDRAALAAARAARLPAAPDPLPGRTFEVETVLDFARETNQRKRTNSTP